MYISTKINKLRYFLNISYNGTNYYGYQIQPNNLTIQEVIQTKISLILRENIYVIGAGRTDTGVHALIYYLHFDCCKTIDNDLFIKRMNSFLPKDIVVNKIYKVSSKAHARFDAITREYVYYISLKKDPFNFNTSWYLNNVKLNIELMNKAASILLITNDFSSFIKSNNDSKNNNCKIKKAYWSDLGNGIICFKIEANRFLRNMVRSIVGTIIDVGTGKITINEFKIIIQSKDRKKAGISAPARGLFLKNITYPSKIFK